MYWTTKRTPPQYRLRQQSIIGAITPADRQIGLYERKVLLVSTTDQHVCLIGSNIILRQSDVDCAKQCRTVSMLWRALMIVMVEARLEIV
ncbi:hypothetical protein NCPPB3923_27310 [Burkholderia glumae]|nr:hypothetical protein NCPPB3923_27310 [Burkholderia glumae]